MSQIAMSYLEILISSWVNLEQQISNITTMNSINDTDLEKLIEKRNKTHYLYSICIIVKIIIHCLKSHLSFVQTRKVAIRLHKAMSRSMLNAVMNFFDKNFLGSILNRYSKDFVVVDTIIPIVIFLIYCAAISIFGTLILIVSVNALFLIPLTILSIIMLFVRKYYLRTGRNLKRLDGITRSPVIGHLNATLEGLLTIRAHKTQSKLIDEFDRHQDLYTSTSFTFLCCTKAFTFITNMFCTIYMSIIILYFLIMNDRRNLSGDVGLAISQAFTLSGILYIVVDIWADVENEMVSIERILQYINIKQEHKKGLILENWPKHGEIKYENVYLFYPDSDRPTLQNLNFTIKPGEKVAILGRTGAGKSSIISTLFRLYEFNGRITIDGVDIKTLSLDFLRSKISVLPQDAVVFSGTL